MPRRALPRLTRVVWLSALGVVALLLVRGAGAQQFSMGSQPDIEKAKREHDAKFEELIKGERQPGPDDQAALDAYAQYFVYLMANTRAQEIKGKLRNLHEEFDRRIKDYTLPDSPYYTKNRKFMEQWTDRLIVAFGQVLKELEGKADQNRISLIHVAMLLPSYARTKQERFGDFLGKILADEKQHDVMKLYAVKGLRNYLPARPSRTADDPDDKKIQETVARDKRRVKAAMEFVERKWDELEPQVAQYIRREALQTLATAQVPAMKVKDGKVELPVAHVLLRALTSGKEGPSPPPSLTEKCEAAIGVCKMKAKLIEDYQPEPGIYLLGRFLNEFITKYTEDFPRFGAKGKGAVKGIPAVPWKLEAERLRKALDELDANLSAGTPTHASAVQLAREAQSSLAKMTLHQQVDQPVLLRKLVERLAPKSGQLFKGVKGIEVDLSEQEAK